MNDLISRQAAIDALLEKGQRSKRYRLGDIWELNFDEIREAIATVPSAQPDVPDTNVGDTISRQAAIERATEEHDFFKGARTPTDKARRDELLNVMCWLGELPSAQLEVIRCKECRHWVSKYRYQCPMKCNDCKHRATETFGYCDFWEQYTCNGEEFFCRYGERKTDE